MIGDRPNGNTRARRRGTQTKLNCIWITGGLNNPRMRAAMSSHDDRRLNVKQPKPLLLERLFPLAYIRCSNSEQEHYHGQQSSGMALLQTFGISLGRARSLYPSFLLLGHKCHLRTHFIDRNTDLRGQHMWGLESGLVGLVSLEVIQGHKMQTLSGKHVGQEGDARVAQKEGE